MRIQIDPPDYLDLTAIKVRKYEEKIVKVLLKRFGIPEEYKYKMLEESHRRWDTRTLTLPLFEQFFPTFPVQLTTTYFPYVMNMFTVADLFSGFDRTLLLRRYEDCQDGYPGLNPAKPFGMVFNWPHLKRGGGGLVLHNHRVDVAVSGTRLLWVSDRGQQVVVETLNVLLDTIESDGANGDNWVPELEGQQETDLEMGLPTEVDPDAQLEAESESESDTADEYATCA